MYTVSNGFKTEVKNFKRTVGGRVVINGVSFGKEKIKNFVIGQALVSEEAFTIGEAFSDSLEIELLNVTNNFAIGQEVKPYLSLKVGNNFEEVPQGIFKITNIEENKGSVKITAFDKMYFLEQEYISGLLYPTSITHVMNEIKTLHGVEYAGSLDSVMVDENLKGYSVKQIIGFVASLQGKNAKFNKNGILTFVGLTNTDYTIANSDYFKLVKGNEYKVSGITCKFGDLGQSLGDNTGNVITFSNPWVKGEILQTIFNKVNGIKFTTGEFKYKSNFALDLGDGITVIDEKGNSLTMPLISQNIRFSGEIIAENKSLGNSNVESGLQQTKFLNKKTLTEVTIELGKLTSRMEETEGNWGSIYEEIGGVREDLTKEIGEVNKKVDDMLDDIGGALADGVIDEAEAIIIKNHILQLEKEKKDLDLRYSNIYNNSFLKDPIKTDLLMAKNDFNTKHTTAITTINNIIADKKATEIEKEQFNTAMANYSTSLANLSLVLEKALDNITQNKLDGLEANTSKKFSEIVQTIDTISAEVGEVKESNSVVVEKVDNIKIGNRNYVLNTSTKRKIIGENRANQTVYIGNITDVEEIKGKEIIAMVKYKTISKTIAGTLRMQTTPNYWVNIINPTEMNLTGETLTKISTLEVGEYTGLHLRFDNFDGEIEVSDIMLSIGNTIIQWTPAPEEIKKEITDVSSSLNDFQGTVNTTFKDGIIEESEALAIGENIKRLNTEKADVDKRYTTIYGNTDLIGVAKTNLYNAKIDFNNKHSSLINTINSAIADKKVTVAEKNSVDTAFTNYNTSISTLTQRVEEALESINAKKKSDAIAGATTEVYGNVYKKTETYTRSETDGKISVASTNINLSVSQTYETKENVTTKIESIAIGSRNLVKNSTGNLGDVTGWSSGTILGSSVANINVDGMESIVCNRNNYTGVDRMLSTTTILSDIVPGDEITISGYYWVSSHGDYPFDDNAQLFVRKWENVGGTGETFDDICIVDIPITETKSKWTRFEKTQKYTGTKTGKQTFNIALRKNGRLFVTGLMVVKGNKPAKTWYPAPEDIDHEIGNVESVANATTEKITELESDGKLTPSEKISLKKDWEIIVKEKSNIEAQATKYGITTEKTNYTNAYDDLNSYLTPIFSTLGTTSTVTGTTTRTKFATYHQRKEEVLKRIAELNKDTTTTLNSSISTINSNISDINVEIGKVTARVSTSESNITELGVKTTNALTKNMATWISINKNPYNSSSTTSEGELWLYGYDSKGNKSNSFGKFFDNGQEIILPNKEINPNSVCPFNQELFLVYSTSTNKLLVAYFNKTNKNWYYTYVNADGTLNDPTSFSGGVPNDSHLFIGYFVMSSTEMVASGALYESPQNYRNVTGLNAYSSAIEERVSVAESVITEEAITNTVKKSFYTKTETEGQITSKGYQTDSQVQQKVDSLQVKFSESGGYNHLKNGYFKNNTNHFSKWGSPSEFGVITNGSDSKKYVKLTTTGTNQGFLQNIDDLIVGKKYTLSAHVTCDNGVVVGIQVFHNGNYWSKKTDDTTAYKNSIIQITFTAQATTAQLQFGRGSFGTNGVSRWYYVQLEDGEIATPYSPNPSEVYDGITTIDKDGITIDSTKADTTNNINADGFLIKRKTDNKELFKVNNGNLTMEGTLKTGTSGQRIEMSEADYKVYNGSAVRGFFGFKSDDVYTNSPKLYMGVNGVGTSSGNAYYSISHYEANNNPQGLGNSYVDMGYYIPTINDWSNIKMYGNRDIRIAPIQNLEITTNYVNGAYSGTDERRLAMFTTSSLDDYNSNLQIGVIANHSNNSGLVLADRYRDNCWEGSNGQNNGSAWRTAVRIHTDSSNNKFFRPLTTAKDIELGSASYPWKKVTATSTYSSEGITYNPISTMDIEENKSLIDKIKFVVPKVKTFSNEEELQMDVTGILDTNLVEVSEEGQAFINNTSFIKLLVKENQKLKAENEELKTKDIELTSVQWDTDFRLSEVEHLLSGASAFTYSAKGSIINTNLNNYRGENMSRYEMAETLILAGTYDKDDTKMRYQLKRHVEIGGLTQEEYDKLIALLDARKFIVETR